MKVSGSTIAKCVTREYRGLLMNLFISFFFIGLTTVAAISQGSSPVWNIVKPSTTGVPGEEVRVMTFDPAGNLWIAARYYFWQEWGLAMLSADQLASEGRILSKATGLPRRAAASMRTGVSTGSTSTPVQAARVSAKNRG